MRKMLLTKFLKNEKKGKRKRKNKKKTYHYVQQ